MRIQDALRKEIELQKFEGVYQWNELTPKQRLAWAEMYSKYNTSSKYTVKDNDKPAEWECYMVGQNGSYVYTPHGIKVPNILMRALQRITLGRKWVKVR